MAHAQKPDIVFRRNGRVHLNRRWRQFSRLLAAEVCASAVVMLDTPYSEVVWRALATHSLRQFPLHFPYRASPCAITFQLESTESWGSTVSLFTVVLFNDAVSYWDCILVVDGCTVGYARTNVIGSRTSFVVASLHSSIHWNICIYG